MSNGSGELENAYFEWLYSHIGSVKNRNPKRSYWFLAKDLFVKEYTWFIPNDDNRVADGKALRLEFLDATGFVLNDPHELWLNLGCSMLEMYIALARRVAFETDMTALEWFWRIMQNLELDLFNDEVYETSVRALRAIQEEVEEVSNRVIERTYSPDGVGGLFPLRSPHHDQRRVELWYQMSEYLLEGLYVHIKPRV